MDHFLNPRNAGELPDATGVGHSGSFEAGRFARIEVRVVDGVIEDIAFKTYGCAPAIAACSLLTEWAKGRRATEARLLRPGRLDEMLGGLPERRRFCADLAIEALAGALG